MSITIDLPKPHPAQRLFLSSPARFKTLMCGRRWGKSLISQTVSITGSLERQEIAYVTPTYQLGKHFYREMVERLPAEVYTGNASELIIRFITGGYIQFFTGENLDALRGRRFHKVIVDEAAFIASLIEAFNNIIRPTLADYLGEAIFLSTPRGKNDFYNLHARGVAGQKDWEAFQFPTSTNPYIAADEIEAARLSLPDAVFRQEFLAEPQDNADNPFGGPFIRACVAPLSSAPAVVYGVDLAKSSDWTVIIGMDAVGRVCHFDRFQKDWHSTKAAVRALPRAPIVMDSTGVGDPIAEDLQNEGMDIHGYKFTASSKQQLMLGLSAAIQQGKVTYPDGPIVSELEIFEYQYGATGVKYSAPQGFHDDCVMSLALAVWGHANKKATGRYSFL